MTERAVLSPGNYIQMVGHCACIGVRWRYIAITVYFAKLRATM
jgi:hypothetical protein